MNTSHITLLCDRSGSMNTIRTDAEGAINAFIVDQRAEPNPCTLLLAHFDDEYETVYTGDLATYDRYTLTPRGSTALFDAMDRAIDATGAKLNAMPEHERPANVFFVVQTDGQENSSRRTNLPSLVAKIRHQEETYSWIFIFLGTGPDAWAQASAFAGTRMVHNTVATAATADSYAGGVALTSSNIRTRRASGPGGQSINYGADVDEAGNVTPTS